MEVLPRNTSSVMGSIVNSIQTFASQNSMRLNPKKYLVRARTKIPYTYVLNGTPLKEADHTKYRMKEEKTIFKPLAGIEPYIFGLLVRRVNHYTTRTNHAGNAASQCNV